MFTERNGMRHYIKDEFTEEDKSLILAGAVLLKVDSHGWGNKAIAQPHVRNLLESWGDSNQETSTANVDIDSGSYVPSDAEIEAAIETVCQRDGTEEANPDALRAEIEQQALKTGRRLHPDWLHIVKVRSKGE